MQHTPAVDLKLRGGKGQVYHAALKKSPSDKPQRGNPTAWLADYYVPFAHLLFFTETDEARLSELYRILG